MDEYEIGQTIMVRGKPYTYQGGDPTDRNSWRENVTPQSVEKALSEPEPKSSGIKDWLRAGAQGLTFGFGDEIESAVTGRDVDEIRGEMDEFRGNHPIASLAAEMAGGLPYMAIPGLNAVRGGQALSTAAQVGRGARAGLLAGAAYGAGTSNADGVAGRAGGAITGGLLGGVTGAAVPVATAMGGAAGRHVRDRTLRAPLEWMGDRMKMPSALTPTTADDVADRLVARALMRDGLSLDEAATRAAGALPEERAVDLFGESTRRSARGAMGVPNDAFDEATDALVNRGEDEISRVGTIINDIFETPDVNLDKVAQGLKEGLRSAADEAYEAAYAVPFVPSEELRKIVKAPGIRAISRQHRATMLDLGVDYPDMFVRGPGGGINPATSVRSLDALKRGLDDAVTAAYKGGRGTEAETLRGVRDRILNELDDRVPEYAAARSVWRGGLETDAALEAGRRMGGQNAPGKAMETALDALSSDAEKEMFRLGWVNSLRDRVLGTTPGHQVAATTLGVKPTGNVRASTRSAFEQLFPEKNTDEFFSRLQREANMRQSERVVMNGSRTAPLQQDINDMNNATGAGAALRSLVTQGPKAGLATMADYAEQAHNSGVAGGVARRLLLEDPKVLVERLRGSVSPDAMRRSILWGGGLNKAGSVGAGLLSGRVGGTAFGNLFN